MSKEIKIKSRFKESLVTNNVRPKKSSFDGISIDPIDINELDMEKVHSTISSNNGFQWYTGGNSILPTTNIITINCSFHRGFSNIDGQPFSRYKLFARRFLNVNRNSNNGTLTVTVGSGGTNVSDVSYDTEFYNNNLSVKITFQYNPTGYQDSCVLHSVENSLQDELTAINVEVNKRPIREEIFDINDVIIAEKLPAIEQDKIVNLQADLSARVLTTAFEPVETKVDNYNQVISVDVNTKDVVLGNMEIFENYFIPITAPFRNDTFIYLNYTTQGVISLQSSGGISAGANKYTFLGDGLLVWRYNFQGNDLVEFGKNIQLNEGNKITFHSAYTPSNDYDAATKKYVDDNAGGSAPVNMVTTDTTQSISGLKTFTNKLKVASTGTQLELAEPTDNVATMLIDRKSGQASIKSIDTASGGWLMMDGAGLNGKVGINFYSLGDVVLANGGGNVGIGTTSPSEKLDVSGTIRASGDIIAYAT